MLNCVAVTVNSVEDGGHIHQQLSKHRPQILYVSEKYKQRRQDQPHADVEEHQTSDGIQQQDELPSKRDIIQYAEHEEHAQRQSEVDECLDVLGEQEQIFGYVDLGKDCCIAHQRGHPLPGRLAEIAEH